jgi:hypothetical protein
VFGAGRGGGGRRDGPEATAGQEAGSHAAAGSLPHTRQRPGSFPEGRVRGAASLPPGGNRGKHRKVRGEGTPSLAQPAVIRTARGGIIPHPGLVVVSWRPGKTPFPGRLSCDPRTRGRNPPLPALGSRPSQRARRSPRNASPEAGAWGCARSRSLGIRPVPEPGLRLGASRALPAAEGTPFASLAFPAM